MADTFGELTQRARTVLTLAQEEAQRLNHPYFDPAHRLLGLVDAHRIIAVLLSA